MLRNDKVKTQNINTRTNNMHTYVHHMYIVYIGTYLCFGTYQKRFISNIFHQNLVFQNNQHPQNHFQTISNEPKKGTVLKAHPLRLQEEPGGPKKSPRSPPKQNPFSNRSPLYENGQTGCSRGGGAAAEELRSRLHQAAPPGGGSRREDVAWAA